MKIMTIETPERTYRLPLMLDGWGVPYEVISKLGNSGYDVFSAYSLNNFINPFHDFVVKGIESSGRKYYGEMFCDTIEGRKQESDEIKPADGAVPVLYTTHTFNTTTGQLEKQAVKWWKMKNGLIVPVEDHSRAEGYSFFFDKTLLPLKTIPFEKRHLAEAAYMKFELPLDEIQGFWGLHEFDYHDFYKKYQKEKPRIVNRYFIPEWKDCGRFGIFAYFYPESRYGFNLMGIRPRDMYIMKNMDIMNI